MIEIHQAFEVFTYQLRELLGVPVVPRFAGAEARWNRLEGWELDRFMREQTAANLATVADALGGMITLLDEIPNMVIRDSIKDTVEMATDGADAGYTAAARGDVVNAFLAARRAAFGAETAFYDKSILALLYFPADEMYAVFLPALLPMSVGLAAVVSKQYQSYKEYRGVAGTQK